MEGKLINERVLLIDIAWMTRKKCTLGDVRRLRNVYDTCKITKDNKEMLLTASSQRILPGVYPTPKTPPLKSTPTAISGDMAKQSETCLDERALHTTGAFCKAIKKQIPCEYARFLGSLLLALTQPVPTIRTLRRQYKKLGGDGRIGRSVGPLPFEKLELVGTALANTGLIFIKVDGIPSGSGDHYRPLARDLHNRPALARICCLRQSNNQRGRKKEREKERKTQ